jgi:signal recognition particle subunit SRP19
MPRKAAVIEEFDDDTELPLPHQPLPNTGLRGPILEAVSSDEDDYPPRAGPASPSGKSKSPFMPPPTNNGRLTGKGTVTDITPYKSWTCIYPIYIDAKRPYGTGQRRVERAKSVWWPLSKDIADAANRLGFGTLHEVNKAHPRDWENPGRVRVQWKKDGKLMNSDIMTKKQLLEMICLQIQSAKAENIPQPPYNIATSRPSVVPIKPPATSNKGKQPMTAKKSPPPLPAKKCSGRKLPIPPEPHPPLASRVSPYSPAISTGVLIETVKAGMNATDNQGSGGGAGLQKGKRKVIRVRG